MQYRRLGVILAAALMVFSVPSFARGNDDGGVTCNGNGSCGTTHNTTNNTTNQGGVGYGGQGGNGLGIGVGYANAQGGKGGSVKNSGNSMSKSSATGGNAAVLGSGNSSNKIDNTNVNANLNSLNNSLSNKNDIKNTNTNVNTDVNDNTNAQGQLQGQQQGQQQGQGQGQNQSTDNANNSSQNVTVNGDNVTYEAAKIPVASAYAPANFPTAPCMGSSSGGAQGIRFGFSIGSTWTDEECQILETARNFQEAGLGNDALYVRCQAKFAKAAPSCKAIAEGDDAAAADAVAAATRREVEPMDIRKANFLGAQLY